MVSVAERYTASAENQRQPEKLDLTFRQGLAFYRGIPTPSETNTLTDQQTKSFLLQNGTRMTIRRPLIEDHDDELIFIRRPGITTIGEVVITFTDEKKGDVREIAYDQDGLVYARWETEDGQIAVEDRSDAQSDKQQEQFQQLGQQLMEQSFLYYSSPLTESPIFSPSLRGLNGDHHHQEKLLRHMPTGEEYMYVSFKVPEQAKNLPDIKEPFPDK